MNFRFLMKKRNGKKRNTYFLKESKGKFPRSQSKKVLLKKRTRETRVKFTKGGFIRRKRIKLSHLSAGILIVFEMKNNEFQRANLCFKWIHLNETMAQISAIVLLLARAACKVSSCWKCEILFCYTGKTENSSTQTKRTSMFVESLKL